MTAPTSPVLGTRRAPVAAGVTVILGAALLWGTFHVTRGSTKFWIVGFLLAAVWVGGARVTAGIPAGSVTVTTVATAAVAGIAAFVVFYVAYRVLREIPVLSGALHGVVGTADAADVVPVLVLAVVNAVAEEVFFRGALFSVVASRSPDAERAPHDAVVASTLIYALVTAASLNVALVIAAIVMGALFAVLRASSGGVVAPALSHVVWSTLMLVALHR